MKTEIEHTVLFQEQGERIDAYLARRHSPYTRGDIQRAIKRGDICINAQPIKTSAIIRQGDTIAGTLEKQENITALPDLSITIPVIFENDDIAVINKPAGISSHPSESERTGTVANWFIAHYPNSITVGEDTLRPGIVHRLDKDTSGVMILAKTQKMFLHLKKQFQDRLVQKTYIALVFGNIKDDTGTISYPIARSPHDPTKMSVLAITSPSQRSAISEFTVLERYLLPFQCTLVEIRPKTGRMHQIRVHMHAFGHPVIGDLKYLRKECRISPTIPSPARQLLHAKHLRFYERDGSFSEYSAEIPDDFKRFMTICS